MSHIQFKWNWIAAAFIARALTREQEAAFEPRMKDCPRAHAELSGRLGALLPMVGSSATGQAFETAGATAHFIK